MLFREDLILFHFVDVLSFRFNAMRMVSGKQTEFVTGDSQSMSIPPSGIPKEVTPTNSPSWVSALTTNLGAPMHF